jgi:hypothetical protein
MAQYDPVNRNMLRLELRRFQTRCEAQQGTIRRSDSIRTVARLGKIAIPFALAEEQLALDTREEVRKTAELRARELLEDLFSHYLKVEPHVRPKIKRTIEDEILQLSGFLNPLRVWAQGRLVTVEQTRSESF